jgi:hypothetical protein
VGNTVTPQFIRNNLSGIAFVLPQESLKEAFCNLSVTPLL